MNSYLFLKVFACEYNKPCSALISHSKTLAITPPTHPKHEESDLKELMYNGNCLRTDKILRS